MAPIQSFAAMVAMAALATAQSSTTIDWPKQTFVTEPDFQPPVISIEKNGETTPGHIVFAETAGGTTAQGGSRIMTQDGELLWQLGSGGEATNLTPTKLFGKDVLVYWTGDKVSNRGDSYGTVTILDDEYNFMYNVTLNDPDLQLYGKYESLVNEHEAFVTPSNTLVAISYDAIPWNLTAAGGPEEGWLRDGVVYEIDIETNEVLFKWRASSTIPITASRCPLGQDSRGGFGNSSDSAWDYVHFNAAESYGDGFVISSRHTFQAIHVKKSGEVEWILHGEDGGDFEFDTAGTFRWQHDIRMHQREGELLMTIHNNENNYTAPYNATTVNLLKMDEEARTVDTVRVFQDPNDRVQSNSGGAVQLFDNGNIFVDHGSQPVIKEYAADGELLLSWRWGPAGTPTGPGMGAYRGFKWEWKGYPTTKPAVSACKNTEGEVDVYMSWNGATEVGSWNVYAGAANATTMSMVAEEVKKTGFETNTTIPSAGSVQVEAIGGLRDASKTRRSAIVVVQDSC
ncbi:Arylsulfotransferase-domain-containing protein [Xylariomycetidae sp. FL0641]|nr:Arylsulfotransferase-domain-containing protein [Xylariomycetidae sp. FL0641]